MRRHVSNKRAAPNGSRQTRKGNQDIQQKSSLWGPETQEMPTFPFSSQLFPSHVRSSVQFALKRHLRGKNVVTDRVGTRDGWVRD